MSRQYIVELAQSVAHHDAKNLFNEFPTAIRTIIEQELWAERTDKDGIPFPSFQAFAEHRLWQGLEIPMDRLLRYCEDDEEAVRLIKGEIQQADTHGGNRGNQYTKKDENECQGDNIPLPNNRGTSASHTLAKLKRDHPEIAKDVIDGKLSANAGAIKAGIRKKKMQAEASPEGIQRWLNEHMPEWRLVNIQTGEALEGVRHG